MKPVFDNYVATLACTERMPSAKLAHYQQQLLARLVHYAFNQLPFWRNRLRCLAGAKGEIDLSRWNEVPLLTRDDVLRHGHDLRTADLAAEYGEAADASTSGSTAESLPIATNGLMFFVTNAMLTRTARRFDMDTSRPLAQIRLADDMPIAPYPEGTTKYGWSPSDPDTPCYQLDVATPVGLQVEWLSRRKPCYLQTLPSGALGIAHAVSPAEGRALGISNVLMYGETVPDGARAFIAERLGARAAAIYSCEEVGHLASECEAAPHYHVAVENALVEIVDDEGRDVRPGEHGRVIVTGFYNYAMPFIRYELGDFAVAGTGPCACGRTLPIISRITGRARNAFAFRDGSRTWLRSLTIQSMHPFVPFSRFQMIQHDFEKIELRYISDGSRRNPDIAGLNAQARKVIHPSVELHVVEVEALVPGPAGKFEEFVSHVRASRIPA
jgi:phenylacetate-CoA ligase